MRHEVLSEAELRTLIDEKDEELRDVITERFDLVTQLTMYQLHNKFPLFDKARVDEIVDKYIAWFGYVEGRNIAYALIGNHKLLVGHDEEGLPKLD